MSAGISLMYKMSGGCTVMKRCADCIHLKRDNAVSLKDTFGKKSHKEVYRCMKHPEYMEHEWEPRSTACHYFSDTDLKDIFLEGDDGQLSFL